MNNPIGFFCQDRPLSDNSDLDRAIVSRIIRRERVFPKPENNPVRRRDELERDGYPVVIAIGSCDIRANPAREMPDEPGRSHRTAVEVIVLPLPGAADDLDLLPGRPDDSQYQLRADLFVPERGKPELILHDPVHDRRDI